MTSFPRLTVRRQTDRLPRIWRGVRRRYLSLLVLTGFGQAAIAGLAAHSLRHALLHSHQANKSIAVPLAFLIAAAVVVGLLRMWERILTEQLSQHYAHEIRLGLLRRNLSQGLSSSLGVAITRTSNDLTSVRNWVSMGIGPLAVGVPLIIGTTVALGMLNPAFAVAALAPVAALTIALWMLSPRTFDRTLELRRYRGRLSAKVADAMLATKSIRAGGGSARELNRIDRASRSMIVAAVHRARFAGALRGAAAAASGLTMAAVVGVGLHDRLPASTIGAATALLGLLAAPVHDLGRSVEYRQAFRAATRMLVPALALTPAEGSQTLDSPALRETPDAFANDPTRLLAASLSSADRIDLPTLVAYPGDRVVVDLGHRRLTSEVLEQFAGIAPATGTILLDGEDLATASAHRRRQVLGYAAQGMLIGRTSIQTAVRYRAPRTPDAAVNELLRLVGLTQTVSALPKGTHTTLTHGGDPLTVPERARLQLARAVLNTPPLLVLDHLDADLGRSGCDTLREVLHGYPGVVLAAGDAPSDYLDATIVWTVGGVSRLAPPHRPTSAFLRSTG